MILEKKEDTSHLIAIDRRSHLEVSDPKHRYGKNLRLYYEEWQRIKFPNRIHRSLSVAAEDVPSSPFADLDGYEEFFRWLDNPQCLPEVSGCPRDQLDGDTVTYCRSTIDRMRYSIAFDKRGRLHRYRRRSSLEELHRSLEDDEDSLLSTGKSGHIFVTRDGTLYTHVKRIEQPPRFHHSSFFAGDVVEAAGILVCDRGERLVLYPHSGHYRPKDKHFLNFLLFLERSGVDLSGVTVDVQRTLRTARLVLPGGEKVKKKDTAWMWGALKLRDFLLVKVGAWDRGMFAELSQAVVNRSYLSNAGVVSLLEKLDLKDGEAWAAALQRIEVELAAERAAVAVEEQERDKQRSPSELQDMDEIDEEALANKAVYPDTYALVQSSMSALRYNAIMPTIRSISFRVAQNVSRRPSDAGGRIKRWCICS